MREGWKYCQLGEVATIKSGYTPSSDDIFDEGDYPYFKVGDMNTDGNEEYLHYTDSYLKAPCKTFPQGAIVFPKNGAAIGTNKKRILKQTSVVDLNTAVLIPKDDIESEFLYYWLQRIDFREITRRGAVPTLDIQELKLSLVPKLSLAEQKRIVAELDLLSSIIDKQKAQLKELDTLAQSIFYDLFGSKNFQRATLESMYKFIDYRGATPNKTKSGVPLITAKNVRQGYIDYSIDEYISEDEYNHRQARGISNKGDILFTTEAPMGYAAIADIDKFSAGQRLITLQLYESSKSLLNNTFTLYYILSASFQQELQGLSTGCTVKGIKASKLKLCTIPIPPITLQQSFALQIELIEQQKMKISQFIDECQKLFDYTMDKYFS